ncbi:hypothetical protein [Saccharopolyspora aridisoli]|uniref:hypothetical protein n=1 Tax=Saccharopolyspora aridisoli TaxID=2530385 RepID=UPI001A9CCB62|nr:hypothetical protein [Saccharopolyspora aridisoli]
MTVGGLISPLLGRLADTSSLQTASTPLILMPLVSWLVFLVLPEPALPVPRES